MNQVQGWGRKKKEALIQNMPEELHWLAECMNDSHFRNKKKKII
jgi:putative endonuclease